MPAIIRVRFETPADALVSRERLHAIVASWLDDGEAHWAKRKPYSIRLPTPSAPDLFHLGLLDDATLARLSDRLHETNGAFRIGRSVGTVVEATPLVLTTWEQLADEADSVDVISLEFVSPTWFRSGQQTHVLPSPITLFGSWRDRWRTIHGRSPDCAFQRRSILVRRLDVSTETFLFRGRRTEGILGRYEIDVSGMEPPERAALDAFASIAPFIGSGAYTSNGFGATDRIGSGGASDCPSARR